VSIVDRAGEKKCTHDRSIAEYDLWRREQASLGCNRCWGDLHACMTQSFRVLIVGPLYGNVNV
jgi:hypothetical protein